MAEDIQEYKQIDLRTYPRRRLYEAFRDRTVPVFSVTTTIDVAALRQYQRSHRLRFYACLSFLITKAANETPEFRHRIVNGGLVEFHRVHPSYTVLLEDDTFAFADSAFSGEFLVDYRSALEAIEQAKHTRAQDAMEGRDQRLFLTNLPWFSFSSIHHPYEENYASIPVITTGKMQPEAGRLLMPLGIQVHHGLVDGLHIGRFIELLTSYCAEPAALLAS